MFGAIIGRKFCRFRFFQYIRTLILWRTPKVCHEKWTHRFDRLKIIKHK